MFQFSDADVLYLTRRAQSILELATPKSPLEDLATQLADRLALATAKGQMAPPHQLSDPETPLVDPESDCVFFVDDPSQREESLSLSANLTHACPLGSDVRRVAIRLNAVLSNLARSLPPDLDELAYSHDTELAAMHRQLRLCDSTLATLNLLIPLAKTLPLHNSRTYWIADTLITIAGLCKTEKNRLTCELNNAVAP